MRMTGLHESNCVGVGFMLLRTAMLPNNCIQLVQLFAHSCCQTVLDQCCCDSDQLFAGSACVLGACGSWRRGEAQSGGPAAA